MESASPLLQTEPHSVPATSLSPLESSLYMVLGLALDSTAFPTPLDLSLSYYALPSAESGPALLQHPKCHLPWPFPTRHSVRLLVLYHPVLKTPTSYPHSQHPVPGFLVSS